jgi:hypothetical protein
MLGADHKRDRQFDDIEIGRHDEQMKASCNRKKLIRGERDHAFDGIELKG